MRKFLLIIVMLLSFCFCNNKVYAANELTYDIDEMKISSTVITFKGWAFIKNIHNNYGGNTTEIKIVAILEDGREVAEANVRYNSNLNNSLYESLCLRGGSNNQCTVPYNQRGVESSNYSCSKNGENCRYDNVSFSATISLDDIAEEATGKNISFVLSVTVRGNNNITKSTDLSVYEEFIKDNNDEKNYSVEIVDASKEAEITVTNGRVISNQFGSYKHGSSFLWKKTSGYRIYSQNVYSWKFSGIRMYRLYFGGLTNRECSRNTVKNGVANISGNCLGYAYATWVRVTGKVIVKVSAPPPQSCSVTDNANLSCNGHNYGSSCSYLIDAGTVYADGIGDCSGGSASVTAQINIVQTGSLNFELDRGPIYSGGGFSYNITYTNNAKWEYTTYGYKGCPSITVESETTCYDYGDSCPEGVSRCNPHSCCTTTTVKSPDCNSNSEYEALINKTVAQKYIGLNSSNVSVMMPDSNVVGRTDTDVGYWECTNNSVGTSWSPNTTITQTCKFTLYDAYIDKKTSNVYYNSFSSEYLNGNSESGEPLYYIPLKMPSGNFYVKANLTGLSSISGMRWSADYTCDVECRQKLYDLSNGGYLYYFRPIALNNPFPNGRTPGVNWIDWIEVTQNQERLLETYTSTNNIEYTITLTNNDIANIKSYNQNKLYSGGRGYLDYSIDSNGNSDFIKTYDIFINGNVNHSALGVYNAGDDIG